MTANDKDTIYIDIDDEITTIIDKLRASSGKIVALVLPKRASTLQSVVNMKLLKRAADEGKKKLVLITTESSLLPLAGAVGLHVAKTPTSRPEIPMAPVAASDAEEQVDETADLLAEDETEGITLAEAANRPVGELAGAATMPTPPRPKPDSGIETLELDNEDKTVPAVGAAAAATAKKAKKDKKLKVPDFDRFRLVLFGGVALLIALIVFFWLAVSVLPRATILIKTNASNVNTNVDFTLSTSANSFDERGRIVPAKQVQVQKTLTGTAQATGQKNNGDKASGSVNMTAKACAPNLGSPSVPAGTGIKSSEGKTYITQESANFSYNSASGSCVTYKTTSGVAIKAQNGGTTYNTGSGTSFTVSSSITATGSASGGTDDIQTVVSQADIDSAKGKISTTDSSSQQELKKQLEDQGLYAITATYNAGMPTTTNSSEVGSAASSVTVTQIYTYTMLGANDAHLKTLVDNDIKGQIDTGQQGILTQGITQGSFKVTEITASGAAMNVQTVAEVGPSIDDAQIAAAAAGKKSGEIKADIGSNPDVTDVSVKLSPFWVTKAPKDVNKITVTVAKPTKTAND